MNGFSIFILAQASSGFSDFARQVPVGLILMFCGSGVALVGVSFLIVRARSQRAKKIMPDPYVPAQAAPRMPMAPDTGDLPDLDLLLGSQTPLPQSPPAAPPAAPTRAARTGTFTVNLAEGGSTQAVEVLTVLRDVVDGGLIVQMGDRTFRDLGADEAFRNNFLKVMREFSPVVKGARQEPKAGSPRETQEVDEIPPHRPTVSLEPAPAQPGSLRDLLIENDVPDSEEQPDVDPVVNTPPPPVTPDGKMPGDLPQFSLYNEPKVVKTRGGLLGRTKTEFVPVPELNLAGAIEAYLQHKLKHTPDFEGRSIHIHPAPDGGVAIEVDGTFYESVGDVTDASVRKFLSASIEEWQARNARKSGG